MFPNIFVTFNLFNDALRSRGYKYFIDTVFKVYNRESFIQGRRPLVSNDKQKNQLRF
jgi:hypothetical protein